MLPSGVVKHPPHQEGARDHVIGYDSGGPFCSERTCEVNALRKQFLDDLRDLTSK